MQADDHDDTLLGPAHQDVAAVELRAGGTALPRRFGVAARETLAYGCELALLDADYADALRVGLPPPRGTATPAEAADPLVVRHTAAAAMQLGEVALAQELAGRLPGSFDRAILTAQLLHQGGHSEQARAAYERVWPLAQTVVEQRDPITRRLVRGTRCERTRTWCPSARVPRRDPGQCR